jgi:hypothetical protein
MFPLCCTDAIIRVSFGPSIRVIELALANSSASA